MRAAPALLLVLAAALPGCQEGEAPPAHMAIAGGSAAEGRRLVVSLGCAACHVVPGLRGPRSHVGPALAGIARRGYIGGVLPNTPDNLVRWLRDPPAVAPQTAMPALGLDPQQARHVAAFLVTLP